MQHKALLPGTGLLQVLLVLMLSHPHFVFMLFRTMAETCQEIFRKEATKSACYIFCLLTCVIPPYLGLLWSEVRRTLMETNHFPMRIKTPKCNSFASTDHKFGLLCYPGPTLMDILLGSLPARRAFSTTQVGFYFYFLILVKSGVPEFNLKQYLRHDTGIHRCCPLPIPFPSLHFHLPTQATYPLLMVPSLHQWPQTRGAFS